MKKKATISYELKFSHARSINALLQHCYIQSHVDIFLAIRSCKLKNLFITIQFNSICLHLRRYLFHKVFPNFCDAYIESAHMYMLIINLRLQYNFIFRVYFINLVKNIPLHYTI